MIDQYLTKICYIINKLFNFYILYLLEQEQELLLYHTNCNTSDTTYKIIFEHFQRLNYIHFLKQCNE